MFEVAEGYEVTMGRWSRQLAPVFLEFVGVCDGERVLDVGCGTGALSSTLASITRAAKIVGIDPSAAFIQAARSQIADPRVTIDWATRKTCLMRTHLLTDAWRFSLQISSRMHRRQRKKCAA